MTISIVIYGFAYCYLILILLIVDLDETFVDRVHVVVISDGIEKLDYSYLEKLESIGIMSTSMNNDYKKIKTCAGNEEVKVAYRDLYFINKDNMSETHRAYGTRNVGHCYSKYMHFTDWLRGLSDEKAGEMMIDNYPIQDFLLGNNEVGKVKHRKFLHKKLPIHVLLKHRNQGKIESHKWFFKGFCDYMNPTYAQIIDCGSTALWNSISYIVMHMETFPDVGGAGGEIECILSEKKPDGTSVSFVESVLLRGQYVEYKLSHYLDKATESLFGFISVLPGAFSTFRWE